MSADAEPLCGEPDCPICPTAEAIDRWYWRQTNEARAIVRPWLPPLTFEQYQDGER